MPPRNSVEGEASAGADVGGRSPGVLYEPDGRHLLDYCRVLYRRRRIGGAVFLLVFVSAFISAVTAAPRYRATVRLQIGSEAPNVVDFREVVSERRSALRSEYYRTQYELLRSRALARETIDQLGLWDDSGPGRGRRRARGFNPVSWATGMVRRAVSFPLRYFTSVFAPPPPPQAAGSTEPRAESLAINRLLAGLRVVPVRDSRIVDVSFASANPNLSAEIVNTLARAYIDQDLAFRRRSSQDAFDWLRERVAQQRRAVEASELALQRYQEEHDAVSLNERQNIVVQELADLNTAATRATTVRIDKEARYREMQSVQDDPQALDRFPEILGNAFIQQQKMRLADLRSNESDLAEELGDLHPDLIAIRSVIGGTEAGLRGEVAKIVDSVRTDFEVARNQEQRLNDALERQRTAALAMNHAGIEFGVLAREAESARGIYESLLQRADETGITSELQTSAIRIVDAAEVPLRPFSPRRGRTVLFGFASGVLAAIGLVFFIDYLDNRLKTPEEVRAFLGQPYFGMLPDANTRDSSDRLFGLDVRPPENFASALRIVRTNLLFSSAEEGGRSVVVTSAEPGEGKSVLASTLAVAIAQTGQRVLLVDCDLRHPRVHEYCQHDRVPGLSDLLAGQAEIEAVIRKTVVPDLEVLTAGTNSPAPTELLASARFGAELAALHERFDWIVIDTPPVQPITDASIVARFVGQVVFVVDAGATNRRAAAAALDRLAQAGARSVGVVLNKVDLEGHPYYYSQYYRGSYRRYYQNA